ncbi:MAG: NBR1-Ig-like domain-containing protein [Bacteroidota bacterium]
MLKTRLMKVQMILALGAILLAACGAGNAPQATPTAVSVDQIQTFAVSTFSSALTMTAAVMPTDTPAPTQTSLATIPALPTTSAGGIPVTGTTPGAAAGGVAATASCYGLTFVSDVSIPDNTQMDPGKTFTKTWKVQNSGSCAWEAGFKFQNTGGESMGASAFSLPKSVASGETYDISVPMTAPDKTGTLRSNWRMSNASGQYFGDEVYVTIVVGNAGAPAATNTPEGTPSQ